MRKRIGQAGWVALGSAFLLLGVAGAVLPLLPATPFLLLAAACYMRGSKRAHDWLVGHPVLGPGIRAFREGRGIPARAKATAIVMLWASLGVSMYVVARADVAALLALVGAGVTFYLLRLPTTAPQPGRPSARGRQ